MICGRHYRIEGNLVTVEGRRVAIIGLVRLADDPAPELAADLNCAGFAVYGAGFMSTQQITIETSTPLILTGDDPIGTAAGVPGFTTSKAAGYTTDADYLHATLGGQNIAVPFLYE